MINKHVSLLLLAFLLASFLTTLVAQTSQGDREAKRQHRQAVLDASLKPDGLHEAAKLNGDTFYMGQSSYGFIRLTTLESLAESSDIAVIGTPLSSEVRLINDGRSIVTQYKVRVLEPIQGKVQWDQVVTVDLLGGKTTFDDGTTAEIEVGDLPRLQIGHHYVIYLEFMKELNRFQPLVGPEGIFELGADGKVLPFATPENTEAAAKGDDVLEFIEKVRDASRFQKRR